MNSGTEEQVNVAVIGAGNMAREHARAFASIDGVRLAGIMSRTRSKAETLAAELGFDNVYDSVSELYEKTKADIVVVAVSVLAIPPITEECMEYPWLILAEKPVGLSVEESERIARLAERKNARVYVALNRRHYSSTIEAQKLLQEQTGPRFIHVMDQQDMDLLRRVGHHPEEVARKAMYANSIHLIDYFSIFGRGNVKQVDVVQPWDPENPGVVIAKIVFDSGDIGLYQAVWNGPGPWGVSVNQGDMRVEMRPLEKITWQEKASRTVYSKEASPDDLDYKPGLLLQANSICEQSIGQTMRLLTSIVDAHQTVKMITSIYAASTNHSHT